MGIDNFAGSKIGRAQHARRAAARMAADSPRSINNGVRLLKLALIVNH